MARLIPNPISDLTQPLHRVEKSLEDVSGELAALQMLPEIRDQLLEVNASLRELLDVLAATRAFPPAA